LREVANQNPIGPTFTLPPARRSEAHLAHTPCTRNEWMAASAASTLNLGVGDPREFMDTPRHKEVSHEQEVYRPAVG
jgi:hypothetical protein